MKRTTIIVLLFGALLASTTTAGSAQSADLKTRLQIAEQMFQERCRKAGEFIYRTAEDVEGVFLMKLRPSGMNYGDQFVMDDPYGSDHGGDAYIKSFLHGFYDGRRPENPTALTPPRNAYRYVEAIDPKDGKRYRYTGRIEEPWRYDSSYSKTYKRFVLDKTLTTGSVPRYGVTYDDISTHKEREYWITGSSLKVIDLKNNEVMAERIGYMMDRRQGNTSGGRAPWLLAADNACPPFANRHGASAQTNQTEKFVEKVLKPILER